MEDLLNFLSDNWKFFTTLVLCLLGGSVYAYITREKDHLVRDIEKLIEECKSCESFDEKSEYKMDSWLELGSGELHRKSFLALRRVKKEMTRYWKIHFDTDMEHL